MTNHHTNSPVPEPLRKAVFAAANGQCEIRIRNVCSRKATQVDHIKPRSKGGSTRRSNLQAACAPCNRAKGDT
ncbi:MAG TPA: HNH endonuclease [Acidimicrobiaceae bacterium]|nr:HNH endonuclease [Acidimicrobiaceae bacterium]